MTFYIHLAAIIASVTIACSRLRWLHYYPHMKARTGKDISHPDRLTGNYKNGILAIFVPLTALLIFVWFFDRSAFTLLYVAFTMWLHIAAGGGVVMWMYSDDKSIENEQNLKDRKEKDALLERQRRDAESQRT